MNIALSVLVIAGVLLSGCAQRVSGPSAAAVQASVTAANRYNDVAVISNARARTKAERIEAKAAVIDKYWK
jgi:hypothetical protein